MPASAAPRLGEFVTLTALIISLVALSIDAMLPALQQIGGDLGVRQARLEPLTQKVADFCGGQRFQKGQADSDLAVVTHHRPDPLAPSAQARNLDPPSRSKDFFNTLSQKQTFSRQGP